MDDLNSITKCGLDSINMNISINTLIELKKFKFHTPAENKKSKCHMLHIGSASTECPDMKVHGHTVDKVSQAVYLGDIISQDGTNSANIRDRAAKGTGQMNTILTLLKTVSFGAKYFEIAVTLREAHLINGMLTSSESWYGLRNKEIEELEEVDKTLIRNILDAPLSSCVESLYLELGLIPIKILLKARRINYYHYLVNLGKDEMLYQFFEAQHKYHKVHKDDWTLQVAEDLKDFGIPENFEFIWSKSKNSFKRLVKIKTKEYALKYLLTKKQKNSKLDNLMYTDLKLQPYLKSAQIPVHEAKNLFRYRVRVANFRENFKEMYKNKTTVCPFCTIHLDTQSHSLQCDEMKIKVKMEGKYDDIFKQKIPANISRTLFKISQLRKDLVEE